MEPSMTITRDNIEALRNEAGMAGDRVMHAVCMVALGEADEDDAKQASHIDQVDAWWMCVDAIERAS